MDSAHYEGARIDQLTSASLDSIEATIGRATEFALVSFVSANSVDESRRDERIPVQTP